MLRHLAAGWFLLWAAWAGAVSCPPPLPQAATGIAAVAKDRGLMWRATRDGRTSYLFGTLHVGKPAWQHFGPSTMAALRASDLLALEVDPSDPALREALAEVRSPALPDAVAARLARAFERACVAPESMATLHPVLQATTLMVLEARWVGMDPGYALEQTLLAQMHALGRRVISLETAQQQKAALVPEDEAEALAVLEQSLAQLEDHSGRRVLARMAAAWERGDLDALEDYAAWCECIANEGDRAFMRRLNDERNVALADGIATQHGTGKRVFAAVGALHMTGPQSLPRLLEQRGFVVQRLGFAR
jgi:uncharacterized protein YbaP (TraB family)